MCIRDRVQRQHVVGRHVTQRERVQVGVGCADRAAEQGGGCLLYTSDAADERSSVDLGGRRIIKKKKKYTKDSVKST